MIAPSTSSATIRRQGRIRMDTIGAAYDLGPVPRQRTRPRAEPMPGSGSATPQAWIEGVAQPVAKQVEPEHREHDRGTGKAEDPPGAAGEVLVRVGEHRAPLGRPRL